MMMAMAGLRPGEAIALLWEHIDFRAKVIRVVESHTMGVTDTPKSGSGRTVPMCDEIADALERLRRLVLTQRRPSLQHAAQYHVVNDPGVLAAACEHVLDDLLLGGEQLDRRVARRVRNAATVCPSARRMTSERRT
jgi:integrase